MNETLASTLHLRKGHEATALASSHARTWSYHGRKINYFSVWEESRAATFYFPGFGRGVERFCLTRSMLGTD